MAALDLPSVTITTMTADDLDVAIEYAAAEGWNPGWSDASTFWAADPEGFFIARLGERPIGCISAVRYGSEFAFVGLYIVAEEYRLQGLGKRLWAVASPHVDGCTIGIDGVVAMQPTYAAAGFVLAHRNVRYEGVLSRADRDPGSACEARADDLESILAYDRDCFGAPRERFLTAWLSQSGAVVRVLPAGDRVAGFAVARPCRDGYKVGPLFANDADDAERLLDAIVLGLPPDSRVILDIPEPNAGARALVLGNGMAPSFETARMYLGTAPAIPLQHVFGITSFELG